MVVLGDDMLLFMHDKPQFDNLKKYIRVNFNMISKSMVSEEFGTFCHMHAYKDHDTVGKVGIGPDYIYLRYKYEILSNTYDPTVLKDVVQLRAMSYSMTLGNTPEVQALIKLKDWPI